VRRTAWLALVLVATGCGAQDEDPGAGADEAPGSPSSSPSRAEPGPQPASPAPSRTRAPRPTGTAVARGSSPFGEMLFDTDDQAIYLFRPEADGRPACYGACATAWPPVLTRGRPEALDGLRPGLLGQVERRDGSTQVTYGGWPLYTYAHEGPGEVLCHDVVLNGGLWLAVGPDGRALPA
jgi:predicted lipoprotein with Yx(FWY)xxD motif